MGQEIACGLDSSKLHNTDLSAMSVSRETSEYRATQDIIKDYSDFVFC